MTIAEDGGVERLEDGRSVGWCVRGPASGVVVGYLHGQPGSRMEVRAFDEQLTRWGIRLLAIDRAGYGETSPAGPDRREVAGDLMAIADHLGLESLPVIGVSMGGVYALTLAAMASDRIERVVLVSGNVLPYDDDAIEAQLSPSEREDLRLLRSGDDAAIEAAYRREVRAMADDRQALFEAITASLRPRERRLATSDMLAMAVDAVAFGLAGGHQGYLDDGRRTLQPLEVDLADVRCPVRAIHGVADDLEPYANLERLTEVVDDIAVLALPGLGHLGPWLWPDLPFVMLNDA